MAVCADIGKSVRTLERKFDFTIMTSGCDPRVKIPREREQYLLHLEANDYCESDALNRKTIFHPAAVIYTRLHRLVRYESAAQPF